MEFEFRYCCPEDIDDILDLEEIVFLHLSKPDLLRKNGRLGFAQCLNAPHSTMGAFVSNRLVAVAILYIPQDEAEDLSLSIKNQEIAVPSANYKICMVHPHYRGNGLQYRMGLMLEEEARKRGIKMLCSTASPYNHPSCKSLEKLGYCIDCHLNKYGFERMLFVKRLE